MATTKAKASKAKMVPKTKPKKTADVTNKNDPGHIGFYITDSKNQTVELPVAPADIIWDYVTDDATVNIINLGEVNHVGNRKLRKIEIESFLPWYVESSHIVDAKDPIRAKKYVAYLKAIQEAKKTIRITVTQTSISMKATLQSFEYGFKNGNGEEYHYKLTFIESRKAGPKKANLANKITRKAKDGTKKTIKGTVKTGKQREEPAYKFNRGSKVYVRGPVWMKPNQKTDLASHYNNYAGVIGTVKKGAQMPYQIKSPWGGQAGWVAKSSLYKRS